MTIRLDDPQEGKAALARLLRLGASNIGGSKEEELMRVMAELGDDPAKRLAWFVYVAGAITAAAAWHFAGDVEEDPSESDAMDALADIEAAVEDALGLT